MTKPIWLEKDFYINCYEASRKKHKNDKCKECGHLLGNHVWVESTDITEFCATFKMDLRRVALFLIYIPPEPPENPCDEEFMEAISS